MKNIRNYLLLSLLICGLVACSDDVTPSNGVTAAPGVTDVPGVSDNPAGTPPATAPAPAACNVFAQTGCADGEKCAFIVDGNEDNSLQGHVGCIADGTVGLDGECTFTVGTGDTCQAGLACDGGTCREVCSETNPNCSNNGSCVAFAIYPDFNLCLASCSVLEQDCEQAGEACYITGATSTACAGEGLLTAGDICMFTNDCTGGHGCLGEDASSAVCLKLCDTSGCLDESGFPNACGCGQCGPAEICYAISDPTLPTFDNIGACFDAVENDCDCTSSPACGPPGP